MAYESLKQEIRQYIKTNGQNEITGQILQNVLIDMVNQYPSLDGYATQQWVESQNYISEADLANYATQAWVSQNFLALSGGTMTGDLTFRSGNGISVYYQYGDPSDPEYDVILIKDGVVSVGNGGDITIGGNSVWHAGNLNPLDYMPRSTAVINSVTGDELGHLTLTGPNFPATVLDFSHQHRWEELIDVPTNLRDLGITEEYLPLSAGSSYPLTGDLYLEANMIRCEYTVSPYLYSAHLDTSGLLVTKAQHGVVEEEYYVDVDCDKITLYSHLEAFDTETHSTVITPSGITIDGNGVATQSWVQQQGYITSAPVTSVAGYTGAVTVANLATALSLSNYTTETWVINQGYITSSGSCAYATSAGSAQILGCNVAQGSTSLADGDVLVYDNGAWYNTPRSTYLSGYATESWVSSNYATQSTVNGLSYINGVALNGDGGLSLTGPNFSATVLDFSHQHRWEELTDRPLIDMWNDTMVAVNGIVSYGKIGAGVSSAPSYMLEVDGQAMIYSNVGIGTAPTSGISLDIDGTARANSFANSSDIRKKDVIDYDVDPGFETVANAPTIRFTWKDRGMLDNRGECVGSIAQYWQMALPEAVMTDSEGYLSMQYDVIALIAAVSVAKRVASHEQRIKELERENALLKMDIKALKGEA